MGPHEAQWQAHPLPCHTGVRREEDAEPRALVRNSNEPAHAGQYQASLVYIYTHTNAHKHTHKHT